MKRYVLKDKVLFDWLCDNSDDFNKEFQKACAQGFEYDNLEFICLSFSTNENSVLWEDEVEVVFKKTAIECTEVYDPYTWNEYPNVIPPEDVSMRVEYVQFNTHGEKGITLRKCAIFRKGEWVDDVLEYPLASIKTCRFRPWED